MDNLTVSKLNRLEALLRTPRRSPLGGRCLNSQISPRSNWERSCSNATLPI